MKRICYAILVFFFIVCLVPHSAVRGQSFSDDAETDAETEAETEAEAEADDSSYEEVLTEWDPSNPTDMGMVEPKPIPELSLSLYDVWFNRFEILKGSSFIDNRMKRAEEEFKRFNETRLDQGIKQPKLFSAALTREGYQYLWTEDPISAIDSFSKAIELDPTNAQAYYGRGQAFLAKSKLSFLSCCIDMVHGYFAQFGDFWQRFFYLGNLFFLVLIGISFWFLALIVVLLIKYSSLLYHDIAELIPIKLSPIVIIIISWTILLVPLMMGKGIVLLLLFWLILIWVYLEKAEKMISGLALVLLFLYPSLLDFGLSFFQLYNKPEPHTLIATYYGGYDPKVAESLQAWIDNHPSDPEPYLMLGMLYRKQGDFFRAKEEYEKALRLDRGNPIIYNNLGNIYYFLNDYHQAVAHFKKAITYGAERAAPHYNLSKAYSSQFEFKSADKEFLEAYQLDKDLISTTQSLQFNSALSNRKLIDEYLPLDTIWKYFSPSTDNVRTKSEELWALFVIGIPLDKARVYAIVLTVILFVVGFVREKIGYARHCLMCGSATCKKCQKHMQSEKYCGHCMQLFIKKDGVDPQMRSEKMLQVNKYKKKIGYSSRILSLIVPGWGHLYIGSSLLGAFLSLLWISLLTRWFYSEKIFSYPYQISVEGNFLISGFIILVLIIVYIFSNLHLSKASAV